MEHTVPVFLHHLCMNVEARIAQLGNFPCQKLNPLGGVAEDNRLIDLKLRRITQLRLISLAAFQKQL